MANAVPYPPDVKTIPVAMPPPRPVRLTEELADDIARAASRGLSLHKIGPAIGLRPDVWGVFVANCPDVTAIVAMANAKGEYAMADAAYSAAQAGDSGAAFKLLSMRWGYREQKDADTSQQLEREVDASVALKNELRKRLTLADVQVLKQIQARIIEGSATTISDADGSA